MSAVPSTLPSTVHELVSASASPDRRLSISEAFSRRGPGNAQSLSFDLGSTRELQTLFATMFEGAMKAAAASQQPVLQALTTQMAQQGAANATLMRELKVKVLIDPENAPVKGFCPRATTGQCPPLGF